MKFPRSKKENFQEVNSNTSDDNSSVNKKHNDGYPHSWQLVVILVGLAFGVFLVAIDTIIISVAIPKITTDFKRLQDVGWYGSAYLLTVTAFQPVSGTMYRLFNIKVVYLTCIIIFEAGSVLCATAPNSFSFILGRAIAGVGASGLLQGATGTITYIAPLAKRPLYIGLVVSMFGISACCSPIIGGVLTDRVGWEWCFWINLPIGAVVFVLLFSFLKLKGADEDIRKLPLRKKLQYLDPLGVVLLLGGVTCLLLALQWGGHKYPWKSSQVIGLLFGFATQLLAFGVLQWKLGETATIPLRVLRQRTVLFGAIALFFTNWSNNVKLYYLPFYFQAVQGVSAIESAIRFLPTAIPLVVATILAGVMVSKWGFYMPIMIFGQVMAAVGSGFLTTLSISTPTVLWATYSVLTGFGIGLCNNIPFSAIQVIIETEGDIFIGNGILTFSGLAGGAIGVQIGESLLVNSLTREVPKYTSLIKPEAVVSAGALGIKQLAQSPEILVGLRKAYATAVDNTMYCACAAICLSLPIAACMQWLNLRKVSATRTAATARALEERRIELLSQDVSKEKTGSWESHLVPNDTPPPPVYHSRAYPTVHNAEHAIPLSASRSASHRRSWQVEGARPASSRYSYADSNRFSLPVISPMGDGGLNYFFRNENSVTDDCSEGGWPIVR